MGATATMRAPTVIGLPPGHAGPASPRGVGANVVGLPPGQAPAALPPDRAAPVYAGPPETLPPANVRAPGGSGYGHDGEFDGAALVAMGAVNARPDLDHSEYLRSRHNGCVVPWTECFARMPCDFFRCDAEGRPLDDPADAAQLGPPPDGETGSPLVMLGQGDGRLPGSRYTVGLPSEPLDPFGHGHEGG
jgi:hypothetical protein